MVASLLAEREGMSGECTDEQRMGVLKTMMEDCMAIDDPLIKLHPWLALQPDFYNRATQQVARDLLGKLMVRCVDGVVLSGIIVETEAYLPEGDAASHAYRGATQRNAAMFEPGGVLYVYMIYGIHHCLNFVTEECGVGSAVLIRAVEPVHGIDQMRMRRGVQKAEQLCNGPGKIAIAFGLTTANSFATVCGPDMYVQPGKDLGEADIITTPRIGITKAANLPLRFYIKNSPFVSKAKPAGEKPEQ